MDIRDKWIKRNIKGTKGEVKEENNIKWFLIYFWHSFYAIMLHQSSKKLILKKMRILKREMMIVTPVEIIKATSKHFKLLLQMMLLLLNSLNHSI